MKSINRSHLQILLKDASIKRRLVDDLRFAPEAITDWHDRDFIAIFNRSHGSGVLIYPECETVVAFRLSRRTSSAKGRVEPIICDICATWRRGTESAIITFDRGNSSVSFLCCEDLLCSLHVRDKTEVALLSRTQLRENMDTPQRIERLGQRLSRILMLV